MSATIHAGRWQDTLPGTYDPARAVVVTDPPFGIRRKSWEDTTPLHVHIAEVLELLPAVRHLFRIPTTALTDRRTPRAGRVCAEVALRRNGTNHPNTVMHGWHAWLVYGRRRLDRRGRGTTRDWVQVDPYAAGPTPPNQATTGRRHDGMTPWQSADWALRTWVEPGRIVIDPFAGTGTIGLRAVANGLDYLGAEREDDWARSASGALEALLGQGTLDLVS